MTQRLTQLLFFPACVINANRATCFLAAFTDGAWFDWYTRVVAGCPAVSGAFRNTLKLCELLQSNDRCGILMIAISEAMLHDSLLNIAMNASVCQRSATNCPN
jgi:hypothetical protein